MDEQMMQEAMMPEQQQMPMQPHQEEDAPPVKQERPFAIKVSDYSETRKKADKEGSDFPDIVSDINDAFEYWSPNADKYRSNIRFTLLNQQWDGKQISDRELGGKPSLTFNMLSTFISEIVGEYCKVLPGIVIRGATTTEENVLSKRINKQYELLDGLIRQILYEARFTTICKRVLRQSLAGGFGVFAIGRDFDGPFSFKQKPVLTALEDPTLAYFSPDAKEITKFDGDYCGDVFLMSRKKLELLYDVDLEGAAGFPTRIAMSDPSGHREKNQLWVGRDFRKEYYHEDIAELSTGEVVLEKNAKKAMEYSMNEQYRMLQRGEINEIEEVTVVNTRKGSYHRVIERVLLANETLEEKVFPGVCLPRIYVDGDSALDEGQQYTKSYSQYAHDQQLMLNYTRSEMVVSVLAAEHAIAIGTPKNFEGHQEDWTNRGRVKGYLPANFDDQAGMPTFQQAPAFNASWLELDRRCVEGLREVLGRNTATDGTGKDALSGVAEQTRITQGNNISNNFIDNLNDGMEQVGRCLVSMVSRMYDTTRRVTTRAANGKINTVMVNEPSQGMSYINTLDIDEADVRVEAGGNFEAQRAAELKMILQYGTLNPAFAAATSDLTVKNLDLKNQNEWVERAEMILPPDIKKQLSDEPEKPEPPPPQLVLEQQKMNNEMATIQNKNKELQLKEVQLMQDAESNRMQHEATMEKTYAERFKAAASLEQSKMTHKQKRMDVVESKEIRKLYNENNELKRYLSTYGRAQNAG